MRVGTTFGREELLERGLATMPIIDNPAAAVRELEERLADPDVALFIGAQGFGFLIAENNHSAFVNACVVIHFYSEALGELEELLRECIAFASAAGLERFQGVDINGLTLRAYRRLLRGLPKDIRILGAAYEVRV
jgi:hypothetical protein